MVSEDSLNMMMGWAILIFVIGFNAMVPVGNTIVHSLGGGSSLNYDQNFNYTVIQTNVSCSSSTGTIAGSCKNISPASGIFNLVASFGDWIDAITYLGQVVTGIFLPYWYLTNDFNLSPLFAAALNGLIWFGYTTVLLYYLAFRNPES